MFLEVVKVVLKDYIACLISSVAPWSDDVTLLKNDTSDPDKQKDKKLIDTGGEKHKLGWSKVTPRELQEPLEQA